MASLDILRSKPFNLKNRITRTLENTLWPIKNFEKYLMFHQYMPKIFHDTNKNSQPTPPPPPTPPLTYLMCGPLEIGIYLLFSLKLTKPKYYGEKYISGEFPHIYRHYCN